MTIFFWFMERENNISKIVTVKTLTCQQNETGILNLIQSIFRFLFWKIYANQYIFNYTMTNLKQPFAIINVINQLGDINSFFFSPGLVCLKSSAVEYNIWAHVPWKENDENIKGPMSPRQQWLTPHPQPNIQPQTSTETELETDRYLISLQPTVAEATFQKRVRTH